MKTEKISQEQLKKIIAYAFKMGEAWALTYHTWFSPTEDENRKQIDNTIFSIFNEFGIKLK